MGELTVYECDLTGRRFGAKNDVLEFEVRRHRHSPFAISTRTVHVDFEALDGVPHVPVHLVFVGVEDGYIVGAAVRRGDGGGVPYHERDSPVISHYEPFFELVEDEILYGGGASDD